MNVEAIFLRVQESVNFSLLVFPLFLITGLFLSLFLYWRECKHELIRNEDAFDIAIVTALGALIVSRLFDFVIRYEYFQWSFARLFFFNVFPGLDFWGAIVGAGIGAFLISKEKKISVLDILDLGSSAVIFLLSFVAFGRFVSGIVLGNYNYLWLYFGLSYFVAFFVIKRLASLKRHKGFFISFLLVSVSFINVALYAFGEEKILIGGYVPYELLAPLVFLIFGFFLWYKLSGRNAVKDVKGVIASILLFVFKTKRVLTTLEEADNLSKTIILAPYLLLKKFAVALKHLGRELMDSFFDFLYTLGVRK